MVKTRLDMILFFVLLGAVLALRSVSPAAAATYTVTTTADSGAGSLRQAILDANANPGTDTITFAIGAMGSQQTILLTTALPAMSDPIILDGWSQGGAGYAGPPLIEINGSTIPTWNTSNGLSITAGDSTVRGLAINYFDIAINLTTAGNNVIAGNYLGLALNGDTPIGNRTGIRITASSEGNRIGTNGDGVDDTAERNIISASGYVQQNNSSGILIDQGSDNHWIAGNYIGTDATGTQDRGNAVNGITTGGIVIIGTNGDGVGDAAEGNLISGNNGHGVSLATESSGSRIAGNKIGTDVTGTAVLPNNANGISVGSCSPGQCSDYIIGTNGDGNSDALEGNLISGNGADGIYLVGGANDVIAGNHIGVNASGTAAIPNASDGIQLQGDGHRVGTNADGISDALEGNLISGNTNFGILFAQTGALNMVVAGNKIGTDITGMASIPNGTNGSPRAGIYLGGSNNLIGSNLDGILNDVERNLISGNTFVSTSGILLQYVPGGQPNTIAGNWIGVDATGQAALPNNVGIAQANGPIVGLVVRNNVIAANDHEGMSLTLNDATVTGNLIGVGADGVTPLGNGYHGISLSGANNIIGGTAPGQGNVIAHNGYSSGNYPNGVRVTTSATGNSIRGNRIYNNAQLGIDLLWPAGVNVNDLGDGDTGGNNLQNYPVLSAATSFNASLIVTGTLNSTANLTFTLDFYSSSVCDASGHGEGEVYLGAGQVTTDANGDAAFSLPVAGLAQSGDVATATATDPDGNTSEFSACIPVVCDEPISNLQASNDSPTQLGQPTQLVATLNSGTGVSYAWDFGDGAGGSGANPLHLYTAVGAYTATVTATNILGTAVATTLVTILPPPTCAATPDDGGTVFGSADETAVQQAINTAVSGATVKIAGTCAGVAIQGGAWQTVYVDAPLTLAGGYAVTNWTTPDPAAYPTTLDAQELGRVVFIADTVPVTLTNLILTNGNFSGSGAGNCPGYGCGGGLYTWGDLSLSNVTIQDSQTRRGGGAYVMGTLTAVDSDWLHNTGTNQRGGALEVYGDVTITGGLVQGNAATYGGGFFADAGLVISGTQFISNTATSTSAGSGGAIYAAGPLEISSALFEDNQSYTGAGAVLHSPGTNEFLSISHTQFISNTTLNTSAQGGALYASGGSTIQTSTFQGNSAPGSSGAGGAIVAFRAITLTNTTLISNTAGSQGGAIYHWGLSETGNSSQVYPLVMADSLLTGNQSGAEGGGLYFRRGFAAANTPVQFVNVTVAGNTAVLQGGGVYLGQPAEITGSSLQNNQSTSAAGGGLYSEDRLNLTETTFQSNSATRAGGAYVTGDLIAVDSDWLVNTGANQRGGALEVYGDAVVTGGLVQGNAATYGGGFFADAGLVISGTQFISNTATSTSAGSGGAVYVAGPLEISGALFEGNQSYTGAGAVLHGPGTNEFLTITHTQFINNTTLNTSAQGGALYAGGGSTIQSSTFQGNSAPGSSGAGGAIVAFRAITLTNTTLISNTAGSQGGAIYHWGLSETGNTSQVYPLVVADSLLADNAAGAEGGGLYFRLGFSANNIPVSIRQTTFRGNTAVLNGGGAYLPQPAMVEASTFRGNASLTANGGGLALALNSTMTSRVVNSVFADNRSEAGGTAVYLSGTGQLTMQHATLTSLSLSPDPALLVAGATAQITNTIVTSHTVGIVATGGAAVTADHSLFYGNQTDVQGVTNLNPVVGDPRFLDAAGGDFHLALGSAAVDVAVATAVTVDWEGDFRPIITHPDIGADEFGDTAVILPGATFTITSAVGSGREIAVIVPPGAVGGQTILHLLPIVTTTVPLPQPQRLVGPGFQLRPTPPGQTLNQIAPTFLLPVAVTLTYTEADVTGIAENSLFLAVLDEMTGEWADATQTCAPAGTIVRDPAANRITVTTCAAGEFALMGSPGAGTIYLPVIIR